jgi:hypothetical protein
MTEHILWDVGLQVDDDINIDELVGKWVHNDEHGYYGRIINVLIYSNWKFLKIGCDDEANEEIEAVTDATLEETFSVFDMARFPHFYHYFDTPEELIAWYQKEHAEEDEAAN